MSTLTEFFLELQSYIGVVKEMSGGREFLSGIGKRALDTAPDLFNKFGDIKDILELRWKWRNDSTPVTGTFSKALTPYSYNKSTKEHSLYLPVTQVGMALNVVNGDVKSFRSDYGQTSVNMVVYKDPSTTVISLGLYLRNDTFAPWVAVFARAMDSIVSYGTDVHLISPRISRDRVQTGFSEYTVKVRLVNFTVGNAMVSVTPAALALLPDAQGQSLLDIAGIQ